MNYKERIEELLEQVDDTNEKGLRRILAFIRGTVEIQKEKTGD